MCGRARAPPAHAARTGRRPWEEVCRRRRRRVARLSAGQIWSFGHPVRETGTGVRFDCLRYNGLIVPRRVIRAAAAAAAQRAGPATRAARVMARSLHVHMLLAAACVAAAAAAGGRGAAAHATLEVNDVRAFAGWPLALELPAAPAAGACAGGPAGWSAARRAAGRSLPPVAAGAGGGRDSKLCSGNRTTGCAPCMHGMLRALHACSRGRGRARHLCGQPGMHSCHYCSHRACMRQCFVCAVLSQAVKLTATIFFSCLLSFSASCCCTHTIHHLIVIYYYCSYI